MYCVILGKLLVFGGIREDDSSSSAVQCYNPSDNTWSQLTSIPVSTRCGSAALIGNHIYCHGGFKKNFLSYNPETDTWQVLAESQEAHGNGRMISYRFVIKILFDYCGFSQPIFLFFWPCWHNF